MKDFTIQKHHSIVVFFHIGNRFGKITNKCVDANQIFNKNELKNNYLKHNDIALPTELNNNKKVSKFGYCPEKPSISDELIKVKLQDALNMIIRY